LRPWTCLASSLLIFALSTLSAAQSGKVEALGRLPESSVPAAMRAAIDARGYRVLLDDNTVAAELWLRKDLPASPKTQAADVIYDRLAVSNLVGVIRFPQASTDYRGQAVPAGFYTLRYALMPNDGNHLGVAPSRDFLLLIPSAADPGPDKSLTFQELVALSRETSHTKHPAPLNLTSPEGGSAPAVSKDDQEHYIFSAGMRLASGEDMPIAIVVKGTAPQ